MKIGGLDVNSRHSNKNRLSKYMVDYRSGSLETPLSLSSTFFISLLVFVPSFGPD